MEGRDNTSIVYVLENGWRSSGQSLTSVLQQMSHGGSDMFMLYKNTCNDRRNGHALMLIKSIYICRVFETDTEAGRLLRKLYGGQKKPDISYPKIKRRQAKDASTLAPFIPGGGVENSSRSQRFPSKITDRATKVPAFTKSNNSRIEIHPIDAMGIKRKPQSQIEVEVNKIKAQMQAYRETNIHQRPQNKEKEKLQQTFMYSAGRSLPEELLPGTELLNRELVHSTASRRCKLGIKNRLSELEDLHADVLEEIQSRQHYIEEMTTLGKLPQVKNMERELLPRIKDLKRLEELIETEKNKNQNNHSD